MTTGRINQIAFVADETRSSTWATGGATPVQADPEHPRGSSELHWRATPSQARRRWRSRARSSDGVSSSPSCAATRCHMQARGSAQGERDRDETSGRETVQRTLRIRTTQQARLKLRSHVHNTGQHGPNERRCVSRVHKEASGTDWTTRGRETHGQPYKRGQTTGCAPYRQ
ncbi:hypothetical protein RRG08_049552 [Elysia crispata]|uniref:Uncharacterized protein n=1 Tax=Elysia crispata TaxID=231223 RepID=A0AAE1CYC9_9GAST|nr:hypothetical protein RRG08_062940 [Elysia crispata]KAK3745128.1 hypothetical protein RRG08_062955 [Elysia crispata]KAK3745143.1 hypothetical protein RRG08_062970 [Elysia crispata]KAK3745158.1 hypothetical protein RRG08_062985 [Elysia crispata]KAK3762688.1 hypothetical protein RRG08_049552 [Elysia crispata]